MARTDSVTIAATTMLKARTALLEDAELRGATVAKLERDGTVRMVLVTLTYVHQLSPGASSAGTSRR